MRLLSFNFFGSIAHSPSQILFASDVTFNLATQFIVASLSTMRVVNEDDEILLITSQGVIVRQQVKDISCQGRAATGVLVQKVDVRAGDSISTVSIVPKEDVVDDESYIPDMEQLV